MERADVGPAPFAMEVDIGAVRASSAALAVATAILDIDLLALPERFAVGHDGEFGDGSKGCAALEAYRDSHRFASRAVEKRCQISGEGMALAAIALMTAAMMRRRWSWKRSEGMQISTSL